MEEWKRLEFEYSKRLRESNSSERRRLYGEAYSVVSGLAVARFPGNKPEERTAGTSKKTVQTLSQILDKDDRVLEIGCGRGYTCMMLAPHVRSIIGTDVSVPSVTEAREVLRKYGVSNAEIKLVSAFELRDVFGREEYTAAVSIDVVEHLHPEDAEDHMRQVLSILKPGGKYIILMPNRLTGPHDITREEFPDAKEALGFHLNESTNRKMAETMRKIGYDKIQSFLPLGISKRPIYLPVQFSVFSENLYRKLPVTVLRRFLNKLILIRLIGHKETRRV